MKNTTQPTAAGPWPLAVGLLAASVTTVIGIANGHEPETVTYRCLVAAAVVTAVAMIVRSLWQLADTGET